MRKSTVYLITVYMSVGAFFNILGVLYLINAHTHNTTEAVLTMTVINACIIAVLTDLAKYHEMQCHKRKHIVRRPIHGATSRRH